ncbi:MAG: hypothetical protein AAB250_10995, partial [Bdellovibrionota bacterium]
MTNLLPRLATSTKSTLVPPEFLAKVIGVFEKQFEVEGEFIADGAIFPQELVLRVGYLEPGRLKQINFEASMDVTKSVSTDGADSTMDRLF